MRVGKSSFSSQQLNLGKQGATGQQHAGNELHEDFADRPERPAVNGSAANSRSKVALSVICGLGLAHVAIIVFAAHPLFPSNIIQLLAPCIAALLCLARAREAEAGYFRRLWYQLAVAFMLWTAAQIEYIWCLAFHRTQPSFPGVPDFLWLFFSFPFLLAASRGQDQHDEDWTTYLDFAQACLSVCILFAVLYLAPQQLSDSVVYDIQSIALILACAVRYSAATASEERGFFRDLTIYAVSYGIMSAAGLLAQDYGSPAGGSTDLCWSLPTLVFCALVARVPQRADASKSGKSRRALLPPHIHGVSSLGISLTSIAAGALLTRYRPGWGIPALAMSCLLLSLRTATREARLHRAQHTLEHAASHDALTGLANRTLLFRELERAGSFAQADRFLLFLDLDRFKTINDSLGHEFGDKLLVHVAHVLRSAVRTCDLVARLGGDEFVILLAGNHEGATPEALAARILNVLGSPVELEGRVLYVTASIGIAPVESGKTAIHLLRDADAAMYKAKSLGRNRAHIFDHSIVEEVTREMEMEAALRSTVEEDGISVVYQPIYSFHGHRLEGFEALSRWNHPREGSISPEEFIPIAEDTGLILELGRQVLRKACKQVAIWNNQFQSSMSVSVNVSALQLADRDFLQNVVATLEECNLDPSLLKLEVTESVLLTESDCPKEVLVSARRAGVGIYLDDFGTGYSSLSYLLEFPFDAIKIDRTFVRDLELDERRTEIVRTIVQLATRLDKKVIIEGVESLSQMQRLAELNCDSVQGFLFSRPLEPEVMTGLLQSNCPLPNSRATMGIQACRRMREAQVLNTVMS